MITLPMAKRKAKKGNDQETIKQIANFIYETGILSKTPRSGLWFLGTGDQSVAEHILRVVFIGFSLGRLTPGVDQEKIINMCLLHDLGEGRTSDLNYVHQKYGRLAEAQAIDDISQAVFFGPEIKSIYLEYEAKKSMEARLAKDADQLEWLATMREEESKGNKKAKEWAIIAYKRLKTPVAKRLGKVILNTNPDEWWFNKKDKWFVDRKNKDKKWNVRKSR